MRKPVAIAIVVGGAITAFPASASAGIMPPEGPPRCERGQLTAYSKTGDFANNFSKALNCAYNQPPGKIKP